MFIEDVSHWDACRRDEYAVEGKMATDAIGFVIVHIYKAPPSETVAVRITGRQAGHTYSTQRPMSES